MKFQINLRYIVSIILFASIHFGAVRLGLQLAYVQQNISPFWPPSGIALAILMLFGKRMWPGIFLSVIFGSILDGDLPSISLGLAFANTLEALIGVWLLRKMGLVRSPQSMQDVISLITSCGLATVLSATLGSITVFLFNKGSAPYYILWLTWWVGNFLGCLVITPFILSWSEVKSWVFTKKFFFEGFSLLVVLSIVTWLVFSNQSDMSSSQQALIYVIFPFIILVALRLDMPGVTSAVVIVSGIALINTIHGIGPFSQSPINESLILLQTFLGVVTLISLILVSTSAERKQAVESLHQKINSLNALNDSSNVFLDNLGKKDVYHIICQLALKNFQISGVWLEKVGQETEITAPLALAHSNIKFQGLSFDELLENKQIQETVKKAYKFSKPIRVDRFDDFGYESDNSVGSFIALPLKYSDKVIGILCLLSTKPYFFTSDLLLLLNSFTNLAAVAIQNFWLFEQVQLGNEQLHALSSRLIEVQEAERLNLSRELHDESGQILAVLLMHLGLLERNVTQPNLLLQNIQSLKEIVRNVLENLHQIAVKLRPASLDKLGLVLGLEQFVKEFSKQNNINVQLEVVGEEIGRLPASIETALFRIVQESLTNVILHANASQVDILLRKKNGSILTMIEDNGVGFEPDHLVQGNRLGFFGMNERIRILDGKFQVESSPGKGTTVKVEVPYENTSFDSR
jgi:signal transduction histidine kinase